MEAQDQPPKIEKPAEVRLADETRESLFLELFALKPNDGKGGTAVKSAEIVRNCGMISALSMPDGWTRSKEMDNVVGNSLYREYSAPGQRDVKLSCFYRGLPLDAAPATSMQRVLSVMPHSLSPQELKAIAPVLRGKENPDDFRLDSAKTEDIGGRRVLVIEGLYKADQKQMKSILAAGGENRDAIHEIEYQAPEKDFARYGKQAVGSMMSVIWRR